MLSTLLKINRQLMKEHYMDFDQIEQLNKDLKGVDFIEHEDDFVSESDLNFDELHEKEYAELPGDLKHLIDQLRHFNKLENQHLYSRSLLKVASRYHRQLRAWLVQNGYGDTLDKEQEASSKRDRSLRKKNSNSSR